MVFEPRILAFLCTWCSYTGADTAGIARINSPANIRAVRVPCSGRVPPEMIIKAFDEGMDGVLILGCHIGECHYGTGNHRTAKRIPILKFILEITGLDPRRLRLDWVSASEGARFAQITNEFCDELRILGPSSWNEINHEAYCGSVPNRKSTFLAGNIVSEKYLDFPRITSQLLIEIQQLFESMNVQAVIGFENTPSGRTRPKIFHNQHEAQKIVWNNTCWNNLAVYLSNWNRSNRQPGTSKRVAITAKDCDLRAINVLIGDNKLIRKDLVLVRMPCGGMTLMNGTVNPSCTSCRTQQPFDVDITIGQDSDYPLSVENKDSPTYVNFQNLDQSEKLEYWNREFERCIRCYACRQVCPVCNCPNCLYEDGNNPYCSIEVGPRNNRTFHLGRAFHLAGRCVSCGACERACPVDIPLGLLYNQITQEIRSTLGYTSGTNIDPSPLVTINLSEMPTSKAGVKETDL